MESIVTKYNLDDCIEWIVSNGFSRIIIQIREDLFKHSKVISDYVTKGVQARLDRPKNIEVYISKSNTCCVDLIVTQHVTDLDGIIHLGEVCFTKPIIKNQETELPILFVFETHVDQNTFTEIYDKLIDQIRVINDSFQESRICIFYDSHYISYINRLADSLSNYSHDSIDIASLKIPSKKWFTSDAHRTRFVYKDDCRNDFEFEQFILRKPVARYTHAIYIGSRPSLQMSLRFPGDLFRLNVREMTIDRINKSRLLNRRIALIDRLKDEEDLKIGVIFTNPLPDISESISTLEPLAKARKHTLYFISMIQTIDECKIGNFDLCDAFIVVNSCSCSTILESLVFNRPIITTEEFKLACGFELEYGGVRWPGTSSHLSEDDMINRRKVSDVSLALIHTRNELLERCSKARTNKWSGLDYTGVSSGEANKLESLEIAKGLEGTASSYSSEPLNKNKLSD